MSSAGQGGNRFAVSQLPAQFSAEDFSDILPKPVEGGRSGDQWTDDAILSRNARAGAIEPGRGVASSSVVDLETEAVASAILLGRLRPAGRVEIAMSASIPRKKVSCGNVA
jgi:hypothetical protein